MSYLSEPTKNMIKYVITMFSFIFLVPIIVHITGFVLRTIDRFIRMHESIAFMEQTVRNLTSSIDELSDILEKHENSLLVQRQKLSDQDIHSEGVSQSIDDLYEAIEIISDRILEDAANAKNDANAPKKANKTKMDDSLNLLQRSIIRCQNKEVFDQFIADCIRIRSDGKTDKSQLLKSFRRWFWSENTAPLCAGLSDEQVLECMYEKFGYMTDEWTGIVFV